MAVSLAYIYLKVSNYKFCKLFAVQSAKSNLPEEMHLIHSNLKKLEQNSTQLRTELTLALDLTANMSADIVQIKERLEKISQSIEAAPTIAQLPKDVEDLKKVFIRDVVI